MSILIRNGNLISMSDMRPKIEIGVDVLIEDGKIVRIDKDIDENVNKVIDASGKVVMPGLINAHSHIGMSIFRETVDGLTTQEWLEKRIFPMEDKLEKEDFYWATLLSSIEMISTGCTTVNDMYFKSDGSIKAATQAGIRLQTTYTLLGEDYNDLFRLNELKRLMEKYRDYDTVTFNCGIHSFYTSKFPYIKRCIEFADHEKLPIHIHFCENQKEHDDIVRTYCVKDASSLIKDHFLGIRNILAHCVKITDEDIKILKETNSYIVHCPVSNLRLGCGIAPVVKMMEEGLCVSLGTDGQGSGSNLDMFEAMKFCSLLQKGSLENPVVMNAYDVLKMATINGAKALGLDNSIGSIDVSKNADIIIVDVSDVITKPTNNIFSQIVYNVKGSNVLTTIIDGKIVMENREISHIDKKEVIDKCSKIIKRINK